MIDGSFKENTTNDKLTMRMITKTITFTFFAFAMLSLKAQSVWNWGEDEDTAKEKQVLYKDYYKSKKYLSALEPLNWLLKNTPNLNPSIYIDGVKIYEALANAETDPAKKEAYIQTALGLYDKRIEVGLGKKADITQRKAGTAYRFYSKTKEKYPYIYEQLTRAYALNGAKMNPGYLVAYMNAIYKYRFAGDELSDQDVIDIYFKISEALNTQRKGATEAQKKKIDKSLDTVDKLLVATKVEISCNFVEQQLGPKLNTEEDPLNMAKNIFNFMLKGKCTERPLAMRAAKIIQEREPTYAVAKLIAQRNAQNNNDEVAIQFFEEAARLTDDATEKAEVYLSIAKIQSGNGQKSLSRNSARRALSYNLQFTDAYKHIGDLYMTSFDQCKGEKSQVLDRAVFIAAYGEYSKAGNKKGMQSAKSQFPSIENIFSEGYEEGQSVTVGCWINTTVKIERRPAN